MKTIKFLGSTVLLCLFVVACAKSNKEEQARLAGGGDTQTMEELDKTLNSRAGAKDEKAFDVEKEGYTSKTVVLTKNAEGTSKNSGEIKVFEEDARRLYDRMKVVATVDNTSTELVTSTKTKTGKNIACSQFTRTGDQLVYSCIIAIDYRTGKLAFADQAINVDAEAKVSTAVYTGAGLSILEGKDGNGILSVKNDDAKALYDTLKVEAKSLTADGWLSTQEKSGVNLRCYKHTALKTDSAPSYTCSFSLNVNDGTVKASDVAAPVVEKPAADTAATAEGAAPATTPETTPEEAN